jgi:hypothetical protein
MIAMNTSTAPTQVEAIVSNRNRTYVPYKTVLWWTGGLSTNLYNAVAMMPAAAR